MDTVIQLKKISHDINLEVIEQCERIENMGSNIGSIHKEESGVSNFFSAVGRSVQSTADSVNSFFTSFFSTPQVCNNPLYSSSHSGTNPLYDGGYSSYSYNPTTTANTTTTTTTLTNVQERPLDLFIKLQDADGSFSLSEEFFKQIGIKKDSIVAAKPADITEIVWATCLAVVFMEVRFADLKDEWFLLADKATKWLKKCIGTKLTFTLEAAKKLIK